MFFALLHRQIFPSWAFCKVWNDFLYFPLFLYQGFLAKDLQAEALKQLDKRIKGTAEQFMKILEQVDAIVSK